MLLGLEQYLGIDPELFQLLQSSVMSSQILSQPSSDTTPIEIDEEHKPDDSESEYHQQDSTLTMPAEESLIPIATKENIGKKPNLMSLLSGKQVNKKQRRKKRDTKISKHKEQSSATSELSEADISFDPSEFEKHLQHQNYLSDLEGKVFGNGKGVSAGELLRKGTDTVVEVPDIEQIAVVEVEEPELIASSLIELTEPEGKRVNAKHLFDGFPKRTKNSNGKWSLKVHLRICPKKLAMIKQYENPCITRGTPGSGTSLMSALMSRKPSKKVTFKLSPEFLKEIEKSLNPLYTKSSGNAKGKPAKSVFALMMQSASKASPKLTAMQKLKELYPPTLTRSLMHVIPENELPPIKNSNMCMLPLRDPTNQLSISSYEGFPSIFTNKKESKLHSIFELSPFQSKVVHIDDIVEHIKGKAPFALTKVAHNRILKEFVLRQEDDSKFLLWPQKFQPPNLETLLLPSQDRTFIKNWILNAFKLLKGQSTKKPRVMQLREQQRRQKQRDSMSAFIVDDFEETEESEEEIFVPVLIVKGPTGSCKSSSIYAALNALGGYVYEVNAGQQRSRRDIYGSLKEFCTTQIVQRRGEDKEFQKGVVLFEDCDILFEQDKTFWTLVQDVINFSKRPIVLTVNEETAIPGGIRDLAEEQNSVVSIRNPNKEVLKQYIWLCSFSQGFDLSTNLQEKIAQDCYIDESYDLRKALMMCQWICGKNEHPGKYLEVHYLEKRIPEIDHGLSILSLSDRLEDVSIADIISNNTLSSILQECQANELLDVYVIHDSLRSTQPTLPYELNIGHYIQDSMEGRYNSHHKSELLFNNLRDKIIDFLNTRSKPVPRFLRDVQTLRSQTRSRSSGSPYDEQIIETQRLPETSVCFSTSNTSFVLDIAPFTRLWAQFQKGIMQWDEQHAHEENAVQLELFLNWRRFHGNMENVLHTLID